MTQSITHSVKMSRTSGVSLPSMDSWAPPPMTFAGSPRHSISFPPGTSPGKSPMGRPPPMIMPDRSPLSTSTSTTPRMQPREFPTRKRGSMSAKESKDSRENRRPSVEEEEAGLALAGMGLGLSAGEMRARRDSVVTNESPAKKAKVELPKQKEKAGKKSCSECRRLKAKCDRVFPCSNCRRRGCALVCPDGDLSCMQGKRLVLASTEQLHERISQLEAALLQAHSQVAKGHHPLLDPQNIDGGFASLTPPHDSPPTHAPSQDHVSPFDHRSSEPSFGILTPKSNHATPAASRMALESLLLSEDAAGPEGKREDEWCGENAAPAMIVGTVGEAPTEDSSERSAVIDRLKTILQVLPPREEAELRANRFCEDSGWYNFILHREELFDTYLPSVYSPSPSNPLTPHKLAAVLIVLTLDNYFDMTTDENNDIIVGEYWDKVQACFDTRFGWAASVAGVQALGLITSFVGFGWRGARASNFYWQRLMTSQAQQLGLHKEPHSSLPESERDFRRRVFHEVYNLDCLLCINHGQRVAIPLESVETAYPTRKSEYDEIRYEYVRQVKHPVIEFGLLPDSRPASFEQIQQLQETVMKFDASVVPQYHCPSLTAEPLPKPTTDPSSIDMARIIRITTSLCHYKALMFLYRPRLRQLITKLRKQVDDSYVFSDDDHQTVSMTYLAARCITTLSADLTLSHPRIAARCWACWVQTFSAAVSMAALAIWCGKYLETTFVESAYSELVTGCTMIREHGAKRAQGIISLLPVLQNIVVARYPTVANLPADQAKINTEGEDMLYLLLGGTVEPKHSTSPTSTFVPPTTGQARNTATTSNGVVGTTGQSGGTGTVHDEILGAATRAWSEIYPLVQSQSANLSTFPPSDPQHPSLSNGDLWSRLQTFYEPAPTFWQGDLYNQYNAQHIPSINSVL